MKKDPKGLAIIIGTKMKKEGKGSKWTDMAEEILACIKDEDAEGLGQALKNFVYVCQDEEE